MDTLNIILLIIAAVCFAGAAFGASVRKVNLVGLGLLAWVLTLLLPHIIKS